MIAMEVQRRLNEGEMIVKTSYAIDCLGHFHMMLGSYNEPGHVSIYPKVSRKVTFRPPFSTGYRCESKPVMIGSNSRPPSPNLNEYHSIPQLGYAEHIKSSVTSPLSIATLTKRGLRSDEKQ